jgi:hypothetical protein
MAVVRFVNSAKEYIQVPDQIMANGTDHLKLIMRRLMKHETQEVM